MRLVSPESVKSKPTAGTYQTNRDRIFGSGLSIAYAIEHTCDKTLKASVLLFQLQTVRKKASEQE